MKNLLKLVALAFYAAALMAFTANTGKLGIFACTLGAVVLGYCGIIVIAHLVATSVRFCRWLILVIGREPDEAYLAELAELDIETEAS